MTLSRALQMLLSKSRLAAVIFLLALGIWYPLHRSTRDARRATAQAAAHRAAVEERISQATAAVQSARLRLESERAAQHQASREVLAAERDLVAFDPDVRWVEPPNVWPEWNPESPYVWLRKEALPQLPVPAFGKDGSLNSDVAAVLAVGQASLDSMNHALRRIVTEHQELELASAQRIEEHLPEIAGREGIKVTIRVDPTHDQSAGLREQFEVTLRRELGEQRAELIMRTAQEWLDSQFGRADADKPKILSAARHPDGTYSLATRSGGSSMSMSGPARLDPYLPQHLVPLFEEILPLPGDISEGDEPTDVP